MYGLRDDEIMYDPTDPREEAIKAVKAYLLAYVVSFAISYVVGRLIRRKLS